MSALIVGLAVDIVAIFVSAMCGMVIWNWFIPPVFPTAPQLTVPFAMGLSFTVSAFISTKQYKLDDLEDDEGVFNAIFSQAMNGIIKPVFLLGFGWIVHSIAF